MTGPLVTCIIHFKFFTIHMVILGLYSFLFTTKTYISIINVSYQNLVTYCNRLNQNTQCNICIVDSKFNNYNVRIYIMYMHTHIHSDIHAYVCKHIPQCLELWPVSYKRLVSFSGREKQHYNKNKYCVSN